MIIVDDRHLLDVLTDNSDDRLRALASDGVATTTSWYFRLARAVASGATTGALSSQFGALEVSAQSAVNERLQVLPTMIVTADTRVLVPLMAACAIVSPSNFLTLEAVAAALVMRATIIVSVISAQIESVTRTHGVDLLVIER